MDETGKEYSDMAKFYTAVVTVFHEDGTLDYEGNKAVYEHLIQAGSDGIVLMGSTGEFCSMTMDMAKELTDLALDTIKGRMDVIVGATASPGLKKSLAIRYTSGLRDFFLQKLSKAGV